jgi:hypothetical protein
MNDEKKIIENKNLATPYAYADGKRASIHRRDSRKRKIMKEEKKRRVKKTSQRTSH